MSQSPPVNSLDAFQYLYPSHKTVQMWQILWVFLVLKAIFAYAWQFYWSGFPPLGFPWFWLNSSGLIGFGWAIVASSWTTFGSFERCVWTLASHNGRWVNFVFLGILKSFVPYTWGCLNLARLVGGVALTLGLGRDGVLMLILFPGLLFSSIFK